MCWRLPGASEGKAPQATGAVKKSPAIAGSVLSQFLVGAALFGAETLISWVLLTLPHARLAPAMDFRQPLTRDGRSSRELVE